MQTHLYTPKNVHTINIIKTQYTVKPQAHQTPAAHTSYVNASYFKFKSLN